MNEIYVSNLSESVTSEELSSFFSSYSPVTCKVNEVDVTKYLQKGKVEVESVEEVQHIQQQVSGRIIEGHRLKISRPISDKLSETTLIVTHLPSTYTQEQFVDLFKPFKTTSVLLDPPKHKAGQSAGNANLTFNDKESALKALDMNGKELAGKVLRVVVSDPSKSNKKKPQNHPKKTESSEDEQIQPKKERKHKCFICKSTGHLTKECPNKVTEKKTKKHQKKE
ncbi:ribonucleoprotein, putative [Entamoeba invadens IP1]|uniref:Ribonucleoprotein, putative n=1 Tax=Entamoeba invadens IP1 TaxID=370355 RepID=L7FM82_ENTIV|nr:ribonucleoprotein, putative [Entamoeba invadens IP1]ELP88556.1 ribonucleoprotein, putative [Entamoeba invadens IP1]|eukprot:XP_004255327.1 ribonucleoprotein, putative [Entamoeba invadens IP1]